MRFKTVWTILLGALVAVTATSMNGGFLLAWPRQPSQWWHDPTTLQARVRREKEKARGVQKVTFPAPDMEYADDIDLKTALAQTTVVVADVIDKSSRLLDARTIGTFYRLRMVEAVSRPTSSVCCDPKDEEFPKDLPALMDNEMYLAGIGGTIELEGVEVTVTEDFEGLLPHGRYMIFLSPSSPGRVSLATVGPRGMFQVKTNGHLESIVNKPSKLGREIQQTYANSFSRMKDDLKKQRNPSQ